MIKRLLPALAGLLILVLTALWGCKTAQNPVQAVPVQYREKVVERLVPVQLPPDSANIVALFECDSRNQVILKELTEIKSQRFRSSYSFSAGQLKLSNRTALDTVYLPAKDSIIYQEVAVQVPVPLEVNHISGWQYAQIYAGRLLMTLLLAFGIYKLIQWKFKALLP